MAASLGGVELSVLGRYLELFGRCEIERDVEVETGRADARCEMEMEVEMESKMYSRHIMD